MISLPKVECFKIRVMKYEKMDDLMTFDISSGEEIYRVMCSQHSAIRHEPTDIVADPFLFVHNDTLYLFYEYKTLYSPAVICMVSTKDLENWSEPRVVLKEEFHLSFPFVFEESGNIYMLPESSETGEIRLYKSQNKDLNSFELVSVLIDDREQGKNVDISYSDSVIYKYGDKYYLFTTLMRKGVNELNLFVSDTLDGKYLKHPQSPIVISNKYGRNGGSILRIGNDLIRVAQDCERGYGEDIHLMTIKELDDNLYKEEPHKEGILSNSTPFYMKGGHHFNMLEFNGSYILATDAKEYHSYFFAKCLHKIKTLGRKWKG